MKRKWLVLTALIGATTAPTLAIADGVLTGDTGLACEAILCLSSGTRPSECTPSLNRYFGISFKKWKDTLKGRINFLNLCPVVSTDTNMSSLVRAIGEGAGRCDASYLNATQMTWSDSGSSISNSLPTYCSTYTSHAYTDLDTTAPRYVGDPARGGYWVEQEKYDQALIEYNDRIAKEDQQNMWNNW
jgi:hypothetical protein